MERFVSKHKLGAFSVIFYTLFICSIYLLISCNSAKTKIPYYKTNTIKFQKSAYGLIFTDIKVNGRELKAMIDFGDPNILQLSSSFVNEVNLKVEKSNFVAKDIAGNTFEINQGIVEEVIIGNWKNENVEFSSSPNEMESVSEQINTKFDAVVGWGYFSKYYTSIDYKNSRFKLSKDKPDYTDILFSSIYNKNSNYLSLPVIIKSSKENLIIDTGAPSSKIDSSFYHGKNLKNLTFKLGDELISLKPQVQNLKILKQINAIGIIGGDFLAKYKVIIDPFEKKLRFK